MRQAEQGPKIVLITPGGFIADHVLTWGWQNQRLIVVNTGYETESDDFPSMEINEPDGAHGLVRNYFTEDVEYLDTHCRRLEVYPGFDADDLDEEEPVIEAWPEDICDACAKVAMLAHSIAMFDYAHKWSPTAVRDDPTIAAALNHVVLGRLRTERDALEAKITEFRKDRVEVTKLEEPEDALVD